MDDMDQMVKMLATAPEEQRRAMVRQRLEMFLSMPAEKRVEGMRGMLRSIGKLSPTEKTRLIKTRTEIVASLPPAERRELLQARIKAGMGLPKDVDEADMKTIEAVLPELPAELRNNFLTTRQELMKARGVSIPSAPPAGGPPSHHGRPMSLQGFFRKRYVCEVCGTIEPLTPR